MKEISCDKKQDNAYVSWHTKKFVSRIDIIDDGLC